MRSITASANLSLSIISFFGFSILEGGVSVDFSTSGIFFSTLFSILAFLESVSSLFNTSLIVISSEFDLLSGFVLILISVEGSVFSFLALLGSMLLLLLITGFSLMIIISCVGISFLNGLSLLGLSKKDGSRFDLNFSKFGRVKIS
ncbi:hypothetical protein EDEG_02396 [Edhazardia aedis USNM 41457]|uniref:Uncharacterized protein n=1 Tax=Edhazardia aedis (strain USNM 41457) TaxID=1003232 RepID=J8ZU82_EDHAE|nr:hypothetical protein EDEG_02396 [Edhazardia aedis USNM 41457]|eukprot:EJW03228.1 hypothetical protein EDEG_02396 [Edhazardia aedis USNM 41457]